MKLSASTLILSFVAAGYFVAIILLRNSYLSPDSLYFLSAAAGGQLDEIDLRYRYWVLFIGAVGESFVPVFYVVTTVSIGRMISHSLNRNYAIIFISLSLPSVFYFSTVFLRDIVLLFISMWAVYTVLTHHSNFKSALSFSLIFFLVYLLRPQLSLVVAIVAMSTFIQSTRFNRAVFGLAVALFLLFSLAVLFNNAIYQHYFDFFSDGHAKNQAQVGVLGTPWADFTQGRAAMNAFLSPLFFWVIPTSGAGIVMDVAYIYEAIFAALMLLVSSSLFFQRLSRRERVILGTLSLGLLASIFMAASSQTHLDVNRFRLFFYPFLITIFAIALKKRYGLGVFITNRGIAFMRRHRRAN